MAISFEQIRTGASAGLQDDGSGGLQIKPGFGLQVDANGVVLDPDTNMFKKAVRVHASSNIADLAAGAPNVIDGVNLVQGDRVLVSGQTTGSQDGIYFVQTLGTGSDGAWLRTADAGTGAEAAGWFVPVLEGTVDANALYQIQAVQGGATIGTDGLTVSLFEGTTAATLAGAGLVANGDALDVNVGAGIEISSDTVRLSAQGNGISGGAGSTLSVDSDTETGGNIQGVNVTANGVGVDIAAIAGTGLEADGSANLRIAAAAAGDGLTGGGGSALAINLEASDPSLQIVADELGLKMSSTGGLQKVATGTALKLNANQSLQVDSNGLTVKDAGVTEAHLNASVAGGGLTGGAGAVLAVGAGTGITVNANDVQIADGGVTGTQLNASVAGNGLTGGGGSALAVGAGTGITVNANDVAINLNSTVNFASSTPVWTFGNETTNEGLFVTGTPVDGNHVPNKTYVDNLVVGLKWLEPASVLAYMGTRTVAQINGLVPSGGWAVVASDAGTPTAGTSDALAAGDIAEFDGTQWKKIVANAGGFVPVGTRAIVSAGGLFAPLTDGVDDNKIATFNGASNTPTLVAPVDGNALLINGDPSFYENSGFTYDTSAWVQFTGAASIVAGAGLTKAGNTLDVGAGNGIAADADTIRVVVDTASTGGTASVAKIGPNGVAVGVDDISIEGSAAGGVLRVKALGISTSLIADLAVTNGKLAAQAVDAAKIANNTITATQIANNTITATQIAGTTITAAEIANATITATQIAGNTITNSEIAANTVALDRLNIRFREETIAAGSFTNTNPSTADLAVAALIGTNADFYNEVYRNGVADMTNTGNGGSPSGSAQYKIDNSGAGSVGKVTIGANIFASGNDYRIKYLSVT